MKSSTLDKGLAVAREAVERYKKLPSTEQRRLEEAGIPIDEALMILFFLIGAENAVDQERQ